MLLTKPLSTFLHANRSPHVHTLLLLTSTGKLLSSSSASPTTLLRNQATIASSVWELYKPLTSAGTITAALPSDSSSPETFSSSSAPDPAISSILIQLESGTMVIRRLRCNLLFVIIGPAPLRSSSSAGGNIGAYTSSTGAITQGISYLSVQSATTSPPRSSYSQTNGEETVGSAGTAFNGASIGTPGTAGVGAGQGAGPSVRVVKRLAEELAKCLDGELEGFTLSTGL